MKLSSYFGPSTLITAAFIGPGTITVCTLAGVSYGYGLLWALVFSVLATIVLQEMAARLGLITKNGIGEAIRKNIKSPALKLAIMGIVISAVLIGNAAYQAGNISGAKLGLESIYPNFKYWPIVIGGMAFILLYIGKYKLIERILIALVLLMSLCFLLTAIIVKPDIGQILSGFIPGHFDFDALILIISLIGTTVVPYNLFLHASTISEKYKSDLELRDLRKENIVSIGLGGLISCLILITSSSAFYGKGIPIESAADISVQLEPLLGAASKYIFALGLFAAGITSTVTAPLAAALAARGLFNWPKNYTDWRFRGVWLCILLLGVVFASLGYSPIEVIKFAQLANGLLLPIIGILLLYLVNQKAIMKKHINSMTRNLLTIIILITTVVISIKTLNAVLHFIG